MFGWRATDPYDHEVVEPVGNDTADAYSADVLYSIHVIHSTGPAMDPPRLNVSTTGVVPGGEGGRFAVSLPCTGKATAEISLIIEVRSNAHMRLLVYGIHISQQIRFTFTADDRSETLNFRRRKVCLASASSILRTVTEDEASKKQNATAIADKESKETGVGGVGRLDPSSSTIVALGAAAGTIALLTVLLTVMYATRKKRLPPAAFDPDSTIHLRRHHKPTAAAGYGYYDRPSSVSAYQKGNSSSNRRLSREDARRRALSLNRGMAPPASFSSNGFHSSRRTGSYATLASFTSVPVGGAPGIVMPPQNTAPSSSLSKNPAMTQRWLDHYSSNPASIWSSATMNTSLTASMGRGPQQPQASTSSLPFSQDSKLVLENGVLKLCPPKQREKADVEREVAMATRDFQREQEMRRSNNRSTDTYTNLQAPKVSSTSSAGDAFDGYSSPAPEQIYPHLMPQNILQAQKRMPRSSSGGSVLV